MTLSEVLRFVHVPEGLAPERGLPSARERARPIGGCRPAAEDDARVSSGFVGAARIFTEGLVHHTTLRPVGPLA